jgi:hypothetical protein
VSLFFKVFHFPREISSFSLKASLETQIPFGIEMIGEKNSLFPHQSPPIPRGI